MNSASRERVKELLARAALLVPAERAAYVRTTAADDAEVLREALDLLPMLDDSGFMGAPTGAGAFVASEQPTLLRGAGAAGASGAGGPGTQVDRYRLLQQIGEGGFGTVFMAEQTEPVTRRVALKIIKPGMDTRQVIARFEAERQALALMDHPNIARVLDAGTTANGRPYFVMELVRGEPITKYCDREGLTIPQRLKLFVDVCRAVQHAHQKGVIHRDIKPGNVLVTVADSAPLPKVIDFGIAKATAARLTDRTLFTELHQLIGTPEYMSPEQADPASADIDTRSDVYSLGVLLYELLTGSTPLDARRLRSSGLQAMIRMIREEDPPRPSLRVGRQSLSDARDARAASDAKAVSDGDSSSILEVARQRASDPIALRRKLRGDLDWIVMKCLEKNRQQRYESPSALADDLERCLTDRTVSATPPSALNSLRKFARRNRGLVLAGTALLTALVLGISGLSVGLILEARQRRIAEDNGERAKAESTRAGEQARVAQAVSDFLNDLLLSADRVREEGRADVTVREVLDRAATRLETGAPPPPEVEASLRRTIGRTYASLGLYPKAEPHLQRALDVREAASGNQSIEYLEHLWDLAWLLLQQDRLAETEQLVRRGVELEHRLRPENLREQSAAQNKLGSLLLVQAKYRQARSEFLVALEYHRRDPNLNRNELAVLLENLAEVSRVLGEYREGLGFAQEAANLAIAEYGEDSERSAGALDTLSTIQARLGMFVEAEAAGRKAIAIQRRVRGERHALVGSALFRLGFTLRLAGKLEQAEECQREAVSIAESELGPRNSRTHDYLCSLGETLLAADRPYEAEPCLLRAIELATPLGVKGNPNLPEYHRSLASAYLDQERYEEAEAIARQTLELYTAAPPRSAWRRAAAEAGLGAALRGQRRFDEAEPLLLGAWAVIESAPDSTKSVRRFVLRELIRFYESSGQPERAEPWRRCLAG